MPITIDEAKGLKEGDRVYILGSTDPYEVLEVVPSPIGELKVRISPKDGAESDETFFTERQLELVSLTAPKPDLKKPPEVKK